MRNAPPGAFDQVPMPDRGDLQAMQQYLADPTHVYSFFDGGQLMFNFELPGEGTVLFSSHLGGYERMLQSLTPRPDVAILGIAGQVRRSSLAVADVAGERQRRAVQGLGGRICAHADALAWRAWQDHLVSARSRAA